ncbi:MAG: hypothetical protein R2932_16465 [Caldilineaceae bacterium]
MLDEPLSALDAKIRVSLRNEIRSIQRQLGITTIYVTHDQEEALSLSDRIVVMSEGKVEQIGTPFEIYNFPKTRFVASFVGTLNLLTATVLDAAQGQVAVDGQPLRLPHCRQLPTVRRSRSRCAPKRSHSMPPATISLLVTLKIFLSWVQLCASMSAFRKRYCRSTSSTTST